MCDLLSLSHHTGLVQSTPLVLWSSGPLVLQDKSCVQIKAFCLAAFAHSNGPDARKRK
jgi:hypothetical protein